MSAISRQVWKTWLRAARYSIAVSSFLKNRSAGSCQVDSLTAQRRFRHIRSGREVRSLAPSREGLAPELAMSCGRDQMAAGGKGIGDSGVGSEEALGRARRAEALHLPLAQSDRDMRALRAVVLALALDVLGAEAEFTSGSAIGPQPVGDELLGRYALASSAACASGAGPRPCRVGSGPACPAPRPRCRPHARNTSVRPAIFTNISSRCQRLLDGPRRRRSRLAISGPKRATQTRTVS